MNDTTNQSEKANRTLMCSVVFLDLVSYSTESVSKQTALKARLDSLVTEAIKDIAENERILVDSGDGAALCFLGNPEDALFTAIHVRDLLGEIGEDVLPLHLRMGINLGPVRTIKDINGQLNVIGDGINIAQRVMSFAKPGQILVSRSYFEMVSRLSEEYSSLFHYIGISRDKHVREHEIYEVSLSSSVGEASGGHYKFGADKDEHISELISAETVSAANKPEIRKTGKYSPVVVKMGVTAMVAGILLLGVVLKLHSVNEGPAPTLSTTSSSPSPAVAPVLKGISPRSTSTSGQDLSREPKAAMATLVLAISPWGEIYVDGKKAGVAPPMSRLMVTAGKHTVKIANTTFPPYTRTVNPGANQTVSIVYKFK